MPVTPQRKEKSPSRDHEFLRTQAGQRRARCALKCGLVDRAAVGAFDFHPRLDASLVHDLHEKEPRTILNEVRVCLTTRDTNTALRIDRNYDERVLVENRLDRFGGFVGVRIGNGSVDGFLFRL